MRLLQVTLLVVGILAFVAAGVAAGSELGDTFWRAGIAVLLTDVVVMKLWPAGGARRAGQ
jgi:hypothetical protein